MNTADHKKLTDIANGNPFNVRTSLLNFLETVEVEKEKKGTRSSAQNKSIHLWLTWVADELDRHGFTLQNIIEKIQRAEIRPTMENLKECLWKPYQLAATTKESSTKLDKSEVDKVYEGLNKFLGENFDGMHIPFPNEANKPSKLDNIHRGRELDYPEYDETLTADKF